MDRKKVVMFVFRGKKGKCLQQALSLLRLRVGHFLSQLLVSIAMVTTYLTPCNFPTALRLWYAWSALTS